ncbi:MAG: RagB/SusD family nutrient uptake outer membrane protein [Flavobacteriaceae bacterium]|nr:RagB/SusD family nutrient uptake outer membrane protein [Flavobacteriaceae bacterium]
MKKYLTLVLSFLFLLGCEDDFLDESNPNTMTPDQFWQSEADALSAIVGAYSPLSNIFCHGRIFTGITQVLSDAVRQQGDFSYRASIFNLQPAQGNSHRNGWEEYWKVIFRANNVLEFVPNIEMDNSNKDNILGEALFLRGYAYFNLVHYFQNIPLVTSPAKSLEETQQPQVEPSLVYDQIKADLTSAISKLPNTWSDDNKGRVTSGSAAGLLGKIHLVLGEYSNAATELKKVIDGTYGTYELDPDYSNNFKESGDNNIESLFEIQFDNTGAWTAGWGADVPSTARYYSYVNDLSRTAVNSWVLDLFLEEATIDGEIDPRAYSTIVWDYPGAKYYGVDFTEKYSNELKDNAKHSVSAKYSFPNVNAKTPAMNTEAVNKKIIRYADVLLMYAEAENEANGPTNGAYNAINEVRNRAKMADLTPGLTKDQFREKVRRERVLELTLEDMRQIDLMRWGQYPKRIIDNPDFRNGELFYVQGREYFPIPQVEVDTNPNIVQNPGY